MVESRGDALSTPVIGVNITATCSRACSRCCPRLDRALLQTSIILALQLGMSAVLCILPDADRIISRFAGTQFFFEGSRPRGARG